MNSPTFDSLPPKDFLVHLKDNPENRRNSLIIGLYESCVVETKNENNIAILKGIRIPEVMSKPNDFTKRR